MITNSTTPAPGPIAGIHHVTAVASNPQRNLDFYTKVLGLRLVKLTVNFDDPSSYHFYFGNEAGDPGTILTFFPWPMAARGRQGVGAVGATSFNMPVGSAEFWMQRLHQRGIEAQDSRRMGDDVIAFADPDGMPLELVASAEGPAPWVRGAGDMPAEHALRGFHGVTLNVRDVEKTSALLESTMGMRAMGREGDRIRFVATGTAGRFAKTVDLLQRPDAPLHKLGAGVVHHVAFRVKDVAEQGQWQQALAAAGLQATPLTDRSYFQSIYFREPGHVLFEFATDAPGFATDEPLASLGHALKLPTQYEPMRSRIEAATPRITLPSGAVVGTRVYAEH